MKINNYKYIIASALALFSACNDLDPVYTVGEADNAIHLTAGIVDGAQTRTRADGDTPNLHVPFSTTTGLRLHIEGEWTGKEPELQQYNATCSTKDATKKFDGAESDPNDVHPLTELSPMIYWDNYGTADPANKENRDKGLTVLGVAVDKGTTAPDVADDKWKGGFEWQVNTNGTDVLKKDLLITNNFNSTATGFAFDTRETENLLEFKHVMSKITINLIAGLGFPSTAPTGKAYVGNTVNKFETDPVFTLTSNKDGESNTEYALTQGTINISTGEIETATTPSTVIAQTTSYPSGDGNLITVRKEALVFPGTTFAGDDAIIGKIEADKNVFYVTAKEIRKAILTIEGGTPDYKTKSGYNYILNITVNKTSVSLSATIANWIDVNTDMDYPKIDINTSYGDPVTTEPSNVFGKDFSLYVSEQKDYVSSPVVYYGEAPTSDGYYAENRWYKQSGEAGKKLYVGDKQAPLYWPNHETYYYFRGVYPRTETNTTSDKPAVSKFTSDSKEHQGIAVSNAQYVQYTYPSDLMIGIPMKKQTDGSYIYDEGIKGISATEGTITLNFTYRMAQVEVHLMSSGAEESNNIDFGSKIQDKEEIAQAKVEIVNGYKEGYILLSDGSAKFATGSTTADYEMTPKNSALPTAIPTKVQYSNATFWNDNPFFVRHDAVIPQNLTNPAEQDLQFKITTYSADGTEDHYYINIKDIKVSKIGTTDYPEGTTITEWEAGKHYVYTLKITKTEVKIEATITDWIPVYAGGDFWL